MFQTLKKKMKDQRGLTLIELLAVIVILGIIAAIAVPSILGIIEKTKEDAKVAEAVQIINAAKLYTTTNPNPGTITKDDLNKYLENVTDTSFSVVVTKDANKFSYTLKTHDAAKVVVGTVDADVTEEQLQTHTSGKKPAPTE